MDILLKINSFFKTFIILIKHTLHHLIINNRSLLHVLFLINLKTDIPEELQNLNEVRKTNVPKHHHGGKVVKIRFHYWLYIL